MEEEKPHHGGASGLPLVDRLKDKGDVTISFERRTTGGLNEYFLVAKYNGGEEKQELANEMPELDICDGMNPPVESAPRYVAMLQSLLPGVEPGLIEPESVERIIISLGQHLDSLANAGIKVGKVGAYESPEKFKEAYREANDNP